MEREAPRLAGRGTCGRGVVLSQTHVAQIHEDQVPLQFYRTLIPTLWGDRAKSLQRAGGAAGAGGARSPSEDCTCAHHFP